MNTCRRLFKSKLMGIYLVTIVSAFALTRVYLGMPFFFSFCVLLIIVRHCVVVPTDSPLKQTATALDIWMLNLWREMLVLALR